MNARWIVGVDGSPESRDALRWALRHRTLLGAELTIVFASRDTAANAGHALAPAVADLVGDVDVEYLTVDRSPGRALIEAADGRDDAAIVIGRRGSGGGWRFGLGSTSRYCVTHATVPTIVVPARWEERDLERVVVGFDGSAHAAAALRWALELAPAASTVTAAMAIEIAPWLTPEIVEARLGDEVETERRRLVAAIDAADPEHIAAREIVVRGARPALSDAGNHADLLVVGQRGAGAVSSLVVGSVSTWILDAAVVPVAVVPTR